jgi:hypothetical protein
MRRPTGIVVAYGEDVDTLRFEVPVR